MDFGVFGEFVDKTPGAGDFDGSAFALIRRLNDAHSPEQLMTRAMECDDFVCGLVDSEKMSSVDGERLHAIFDEALGARIRALFPK